MDIDKVALLTGETHNVNAKVLGTDGWVITAESENSDIVAASCAGGKITIKALSAGTTNITVTASKDGETSLTKTITVTVAPEGSEAVKAETTVNGSDETITVSGDFLTSGGSDNVEVSGNTVTIDAASAASGITSSKVVISQEAAEALFVTAKLEDAALSAPDEQIRANVVRLGSALVDDFEDFEEELA